MSDFYDEKPDECNTRKNKERGRKYLFAKRIGTLTLSALLFGSVSAGAFQAVNALSGHSGNNFAASASSDGDSSNHLLKATTVSDVSSANPSASLDVSEIVKSAMPSIVSITNKSVQEVQNYFSRFGYGYLQPQTEETESCGSGIIIGKNETELLIVTNYHVIEDADTLSASFIDNQVYEAVVKGTDAENDLAVIAVPLESISDDTMAQISVAPIGDSDELNVGEQVVAIGNALGYGQSVTTGIVSALNRSITSETDSESESLTYIQTDAAINPGNSGGALLNMKGEVIGINSAKLSSTEIEGMGYAIPTSRASDIIERLMNQTTRTKVDVSEQGTLGIQGIDVTSEIQTAYQIPQGIYISKITSGSAAEDAGLRPGSVITKFDGQTISGVTALQELLQYYKAGESVELLLQVPKDGSYQEQTVTLTLKSSNPI